ncbi:DUF5011 domain-containing protein [Mollicutes bacterium LVI A0078]|nr:DUF5011 domain-containing protein [Mollicutes bacterium LVI A0075]WOO90110.1 DUF5011 domain-containing protein [Mollicutes bacterium LVI A0078]
MNDKKNNKSKLVLVSTLIFAFGLFQSIPSFNLYASDIDTELKEPAVDANVQSAGEKTLSYKLTADPSSVLEMSSKKMYSEDELIDILGIKVNDSTDLATSKNLDFSGYYDTTKPGTYHITVRLFGHYKSIETDLVVDQVPAQISAAKNSLSVNYGQTIADLKAEFGINAWEFDEMAGDLNENVTMTGSVDYNLPGIYKLTFSTHDDDTPRTTASVEVEVMVVDGAPAISTLPANINMVEEAKTLTDASIISESGVGFKYSDGTAVDASNIMLSVGASGSTAFDYGKTPGTYHAVATAYNQSGTKSIMAEFDIIVSAVKPTIVSANKNYYVPVGTPLPDQATLESWFKISGYEFSGVENGYSISYYFVNSQGYKNSHPTNNPIKFVIVDNDGQTDEVEVNLHIKKKGFIPGTDPVPPVVHSNTVFESPEGTILSDEMLIQKFIVAVIDDEDGNYTIEVSHDIDWYYAKDYPVTFKVTDGNGLSTIVVKTLRLTDLLPSISYKYNPIYYTVGNPLPDFKQAFGISAKEIVKGDLTSQVKVFGLANVQTPGTHYITFRVYDNEGNEDSIILKVITSEPVNTAPTISGTDFIEFPEDNGEALTKAQLIYMFNIQAMDFEDGMLSVDKIDIIGAPADLHHPDVYIIKFTGTDSKGNSSVFKAVLKVTDVKPTMKQKIKHSYRPVGMPIEDLIAEYKIEATEFTKGDLNGSIVITYEKIGEYFDMPVDEIDYDEPGFYRIKFTATDEEGNMVYKKAYLDIGSSGNVIEFDALGEITIPEELNLSVKDLIAMFEPYAIEYTEEDIIDLFEQIGLEGHYDLHKPSKEGDPYELILTLTYKDEVYEIPVSLNITDILPTIEADNELVTIKDTDELTIEKLLKLFGITASEINENDLFDQVKVDFSSILSKGGKLIPGAYPVVFTVVDEEGNEVSTTTTVQVQDATVDDEDTSEVDDTDTSEVDDTDTSEVDDTDDTDTNEVDDVDDVDDTDDEMEASSTSVMTLAQTGGSIVSLLVIAGFVLVVTLMVRASILNSRK